MASAVTLAALSVALLLQLVVVADLYSETYVDDQGHIQDVDTIFLVQVTEGRSTQWDPVFQFSVPNFPK